MVNKKRILSLCLCFGVLALGGCAKTHDLTEEEQDLIAEYSAGLLLQYEDRYERKLVPEEPEATVTVAPALVTPAPTPAPTLEETTNANASADSEEEEQFQQVSLNDMYKVKGVAVSYQSFVVGREYPKKLSAFQMTAKKGEQFFVARFQVKNMTNKKKTINLQKHELAYPLILNEEEYQPTIVIQKNGGLNYLKTTLSGNASEEAILVYNIPTSVKKVTSAVLTVRDEKEKKESTITCK
nr:hypothetical protein [Eubacterium sp.]